MDNLQRDFLAQCFNACGSGGHSIFDHRDRVDVLLSAGEVRSGLLLLLLLLQLLLPLLLPLLLSLLLLVLLVLLLVLLL